MTKIKKAIKGKPAVKKAAKKVVKVPKKAVRHRKIAVKKIAGAPATAKTNHKINGKHVSLPPIDEKQKVETLSPMEKKSESIINSDNAQQLSKKIKDGQRGDIIVSLRNISRNEKLVKLFKDDFSDKEIFIDSVYSTITYNEIVDLVKAGKYRLLGIYHNQVKGDASITVPHMRLMHHEKSIFGGSITTPMKMFKDVYQFQNDVLYTTIPQAKELLVQAGCSFEFYLQAEDVVQLSFFIEKL